MKKPGGETSLALDGDLNHKTRRLLLSEVLGRGGTWTDPRVLVATGLVLVDFTKPWVEKVSYSTEDAIVKVGDRFVTVNDSEDYRWCRQVRALGGSIWVTRKVGTAHVGMREHIIPQAVE
jgi:hypothetical protein